MPEKLTIYVCDECKEEYLTHEEALSCENSHMDAVRLRERIRQESNFVRLNAESLDHFKQLLVEFTERHYDATIRFTRFTSQLNRLKYASALGPYASGSPGWTLDIAGEITDPTGKVGIQHIAGEDAIFSGRRAYPGKPYITGLRLSTGQLGARFRCRAYLVADEFPILNEKLKELTGLFTKHDEYVMVVNRVTCEHNAKINEVLDTDPALVTYRSMVASLEDKISAREDDLWAMHEPERQAAIPERDVDMDRLSELRNDLVASDREVRAIAQAIQEGE